MLSGKDGKWKTRLEEFPQPNQVVTLLSLGDVKHDVLSYLKAHPNIQTPEMSTKYITKEREGTRLKSKGQVKRKQDYLLNR